MRWTAGAAVRHACACSEQARDARIALYELLKVFTPYQPPRSPGAAPFLTTDPTMMQQTLLHSNRNTG
jgi:hypothetical protein